MIIVASFWEFGWFAPISEVSLWEYPLDDFSVDKLCMIPVSGINNRKVEEHPDIQSVLNKYSDIIPVFVDEKGKIGLTEFKHPKDVLYITGKAGYSPYLSMGKDSLSVRISTIKNKAKIWSHQAICLVLYDRMLKGWQ